MNVSVEIDGLLILDEDLSKLIRWHAINPLHEAIQIHVLEPAAQHLLDQQVAVEEAVIIYRDRNYLDVVIAHFEVLKRSQDPLDTFVSIMRIRDFARSNPQAVLINSGDRVAVDHVLDQSLVDIINRMIVVFGPLRQEHSNPAHKLSYKTDVGRVFQAAEAVSYLEVLDVIYVLNYKNIGQGSIERQQYNSFLFVLT